MNELINPLHDKMPVILNIQDIDLWLDPKITDPEKLKNLFVPYACSSEKLEMYLVSDIVNSPRNDTAECISPLAIN
jgi:putative SOS response-associated peptidase YedK